MLERYGAWLDGTITEPGGEPFWHAVVRLIVSVTAFCVIGGLVLAALASLVA